MASLDYLIEVMRQYPHCALLVMNDAEKSLRPYLGSAHEACDSILLEILRQSEAFPTWRLDASAG
jgi:hypothetical protein